ncbi:hypothetical protein PoB_000647000 [Plakobranchus ocellatus]|uniref:Uncharacterized protein n=1 Tax=Plakobranchus ocellatus TaxID=259542 RepID=A0AAV3YB34_9GAST|nr:hypothetical protein PoB_000647000 [Plakobranchus ocellatus]
MLAARPQSYLRLFSLSRVTELVEGLIPAGFRGRGSGTPTPPDPALNFQHALHTLESKQTDLPDNIVLRLDLARPKCVQLLHTANTHKSHTDGASFSLECSTCSPSTGGISTHIAYKRGVGGTVACESALRSAGTLLSRVRAPPSAPRPDEGP